jgi:predicted P-loop ATPase
MGALIKMPTAEPTTDPDPSVLEILRAEGWLKCDKTGALQSVSGSLAPIDCILRLDPWLRGQIRFNDLAAQVVVHAHPLDDETITGLTVWLQRAYRCSVATSRVHEVVIAIARENRFHPVSRWLDGLEWDGTRRVDTWLSRYLGAEDSALHREYARRWLISACARAHAPGCKVDTALIIVGPQGAGKSSTLAILCGEEWYSSTQIDLTDAKAAAERMTGVWIFELGEIAGLRRGDFAAIKQALTTQVDKYRPAYGRCTVARPRTCVFAGTTNEQSVLTDSTGSRRFWCVKVVSCDRDALAADRDQIWAEANAAYRAGERWWLDESIEQERTESAEAFERVDPWMSTIETKIRKDFGGSAGVDINDIIAEVEPDVGRRTPGTMHRVSECLRSLGYEPTQVKVRGQKLRRWVCS